MPSVVAQGMVGRSAPVDNSGLSRVIYHSRATFAFAGHDIHRMIEAAQVRNLSESLSGVVVYDRSRFYQWIEGPTAGVARVLESIHLDSRHDDVHVLSHVTVGARVFGGHVMMLAGDMADGTAGRVLHPSMAAIEALRLTPELAEDILASLAPQRRSGGRAAVRKPARPTARILRDVILSRVIPELAVRHGLPGSGGPPQHSMAMALARVLAVGDSRAASDIVAGALTGPGYLVPLLARLAEPAARLLGDFWAADEVGELDVTLGLCCLRTAVRQAALHAQPASPSPQAPRVLCAAQPGEPHALGPAFHSEAMWQAGWSPRVAPAASQDALLEMLAGERFDCLDLSLSAAFARSENLPGVADTIARARRASRNKSLAIVVSGRAAAGADARMIGADSAIPSALYMLGAVRQAVALRAR